tara:strand:- start:4033 stop:4137 length:105 start_codon:yes stop_codon:yes gene_type:complete
MAVFGEEFRVLKVQKEKSFLALIYMDLSTNNIFF